MSVGFKDYMSVDTKPGEDDQIKYNAKKRKRYDEAKSKTVCKDCGDEFNKPTTTCKHDCSNPNGKNWVKEYSESKENFKPHMMYDPKTGKGYMAKKYEDHIRMQKMGYTHDEPKNEEVEEALNVQQRLARSRMMRKMKSRIAMGRKRAMRKTAGKDRLQKRAKRAARTAILKKLTKDVPKGDLNFARRQEIEKRLDKMAPRIDRLAKKMFPGIRKKEVMRKKG